MHVPGSSRLPSLATAACAAALLSAGCIQPFLIENFKTTYQPRTRVVAVAPLANTTFQPNAPVVLWEAIHGALVQHESEYSVTIQREGEMRRRIEQAFLSTQAAAVLPISDLCAVLGTDAVMVGTVTGFVRYGVEHDAPTGAAYGHSEILVNLQIHDCTDTELLWGFKVKKSGQYLTSAAGLRQKVGGEVADRFPYKKE
jgi:hypothetical protein